MPKWVLPALGCLVAVMFWPGMAGAADASRWALLAVAIPLLLCFVDIVPGRIHAIGALLLIWAIVSWLWTPVPYDGLAALVGVVILAGCFVIGHAIEDLKPLYRGLAIGLGVSSVIAILQALGYHPVITVDEGEVNAGLFVNPNMLGEIAALTFVALVASGQWLWTPAVLPALLLSQSRASLAAIGVCGVIWCWHRLRFYTFALVPLLVAVAFLVAPSKWLHGPGFDYRLIIWRDTLQGLTIFGRGIGSYYAAFLQYATHIDKIAYQPAHAHNEFLELCFELGLPGAALFATFAVLVFRQAQAPERMVLLALFVIASFGFPLHTPATVFLVGVVAGFAARSRHTVGDRKLQSRSTLYPRLERVALIVAERSRAIVSLPARISIGTGAADHSR